MSELYTHFADLLKKNGFVFKYTYPHTFINESTNLMFQVYIQCIEIRINDSDVIIFEGTRRTPFHEIEKIFSTYGRKGKINRIKERIYAKYQTNTRK